MVLDNRSFNQTYNLQRRARHMPERLAECGNSGVEHKALSSDASYSQAESRHLTEERWIEDYLSVLEQHNTGKHGFFCSSCKRHLDVHSFSAFRKTCKKCLKSRKRLRVKSCTQNDFSEQTCSSCKIRKHSKAFDAFHKTCIRCLCRRASRSKWYFTKSELYSELDYPDVN